MLTRHPTLLAHSKKHSQTHQAIQNILFGKDIFSPIPLYIAFCGSLSPAPL